MTKRVHLYAPTAKRLVMGLERWGMQGAQPSFRNQHCVMEPAATLWNTQEHRPDDGRGINHPDARLIAEAPVLLAACRAIVNASTDSDFCAKSIDRYLTMATASIVRIDGVADENTNP